MPRIFDVVVGVGVVGAIVFAGLALQSTQSTKKAPADVPLQIAAGATPRSAAAGGDSPVRVLGGSITARSTVTWTANGSGFSTTTSTYPYTEISLQGVVPNSATVNQPFGWFDLNVPWEIDVYSRAIDGTDQSTVTDGIRVCSNYSTGATCATTGSPSNSVTILPLGINSQIAAVPDDGADYGKRFVHTACAASATNPNPRCEFIGHIKVTLYNTTGAASMFTYACPASECSVGVRPRALF